MTTKQWQNWGMLLLGIWLFISPWAMGYVEGYSNAAWSAWIVGVAIAAFAVAEIYKMQLWEEWVTLLLGVWTLVSPWVLAFTSHRQAMGNDVVVGALVVVLALWALARDHAFDKLMHRA